MPDHESGLLAYAVLPFSFFFVAVYTESLALFLSVAFLASLRARNPLLAFTCGFFAGLTRVTSLALLLLGIDELRDARREMRLASVGPAAGVATFMSYLWIATGDPLRFLHAQEHFGRVTSFSAGRLLQVIGRSFRTADPWDDVAVISLLLVASGAAMLIAKRRIGEGLYCAALVTLPLATVTLTSLHRYALLAFPAFPLLAGLLHNRIVYFAVVAVEICFLFVCARHFALMHWMG